MPGEKQWSHRPSRPMACLPSASDPREPLSWVSIVMLAQKHLMLKPSLPLNMTSSVRNFPPSPQSNPTPCRRRAPNIQDDSTVLIVICPQNEEGKVSVLPTRSLPIIGSTSSCHYALHIPAHSFPKKVGLLLSCLHTHVNTHALVTDIIL